jgi:hypothetical protein
MSLLKSAGFVALAQPRGGKIVTGTTTAARHRRQRILPASGCRLDAAPHTGAACSAPGQTPRRCCGLRAPQSNQRGLASILGASARAMVYRWQPPTAGLQNVPLEGSVSP